MPAKKQLKTTNIKGKEYVEVHERISYFRENFGGYRLLSQIMSPMEFIDDMVVMKASVLDPEGNFVAEGHALERRNDENSYVNFTSHLENCETSAWGRALANFGIGVDASVASADEVINAIAQQEAIKEKKPIAAAPKPKTESEPPPLKVVESKEDTPPPPPPPPPADEQETVVELPEPPDALPIVVDDRPIPEDVMNVIADAFGEFDLTLTHLENYIGMKKESWIMDTKSELLMYYEAMADGNTEIREKILAKSA